MKAIFYFALCLTFILRVQAQSKADKELEQRIEKLKTTTTVFFFRDEDKKRLEQYKKAITSVWTITPLIFANYSEMEKYDNQGYSHFVFQGYHTKHAMSGNYGSVNNRVTLTNTHKYLNLRLNFNERDKKKQSDLCRVELFWRMKNDDHLLPDEIDYFNFSPVQAGAFLKVVNNDLKNNFVMGNYHQVKEPISRLLRKDTLYIPDNVLIEFGAMSGKEKKLTDNIFASYPYPYRICSANELFTIFFDGGKGRFLFDYTKSSTDKFVSVIDVKEGKIIHRVYIPTSYNLKSKDIDRILEY